MARGDEILIVEDEDELRSMYSGWLAEEYQVRTAGDAETAFESLTETVDIVLLDRKLPDADALTFLQDFRVRNHDCRIMILTAVEPEPSVLDADFDAYMTKPIREPQLHEAVEALATDDTTTLAGIEGVRLW